MAEFLALAARREAIRLEVKYYIEEFRNIQTQALARYLEKKGIVSDVPPAALILGLHSLVQTLSVEEAPGVSNGHTELQHVVEAWLTSFSKTDGVRTRARK